MYLSDIFIFLNVSSVQQMHVHWNSICVHKSEYFYTFDENVKSYSVCRVIDIGISAWWNIRTAELNHWNFNQIEKAAANLI